MLYFLAGLFSYYNVMHIKRICHNLMNGGELSSKTPKSPHLFLCTVALPLTHCAGNCNTAPFNTAGGLEYQCAGKNDEGLGLLGIAACTNASLCLKRNKKALKGPHLLFERERLAICHHF